MPVSVSVSVYLSFSQVTVEHCMVCRNVTMYMPVSVISLPPKLLLSIGWCAGRSLYMPVSVSVSVCLSLFLPSFY